MDDAEILKAYRTVAAAAGDVPVYIISRTDMERMVEAERERCLHAVKAVHDKQAETSIKARMACFDIAEAIRSQP